MTKLIDKIRPEVLKALDKHCKPHYPTSHRMIIASLQDLYCYRELTIEQVSQLKTFLPREFELDYEGRVQLSTLEFENAQELIEAIVEKVHKLFVEKQEDND